MTGLLLDLNTLVVRPRISIDGKPYEILSADELSVLTSHLLTNRGKRIDELMKAADLEPAEADELVELVREISDTVMEPVPVEIRERLTDAQRMSVTEAFSMLLLAKKAGTAAATLKSLLPAAAMEEPKSRAPKPTGVKRPRGSSASTAATRAGGSAKRRSRS